MEEIVYIVLLKNCVRRHPLGLLTQIWQKSGIHRRMADLLLLMYLQIQIAMPGGYAQSVDTNGKQNVQIGI